MTHSIRFILPILILMTAVPDKPAVAQGGDPWSTVIAIGGPMVAKYGGNALRSVLSNPQKIRWLFTGMHHIWWACEYSDGFRVYNNFRSYRTINDTAPYFLGTSDGDCDAVTEQGRHYCFPRDARTLIQQHGQVVDIYPAGRAD